MSAMIPVPAVNGVLYAFQQSDAFAQTIIFLLFILSIQAWTIMIDKGMMVRRARREGQKFLDRFAASSSPMDMLLQVDRHSGPIADVYEAGIQELADILDIEPQLLDNYARRQSFPRALTIHEVDRVRSTLERTDRKSVV